MPPHARLAGSHGDSLAAGHGRQKLKLGAISYVTSRHGVDANEDMAHAGLVYLCQMAVEYYEALTGALLKNRPVDPYLQLGDVDRPEVARARKRLQLAAFAYVNARHGIDADQGMSRAGLHLLTQASTDYYEALAAAAPKKQPADVSRQLGNGASR